MKSSLFPNCSIGSLCTVVVAFFLALLLTTPTNAQGPPTPDCDTSPNALTEAFAKLNITTDPQVVEHTCIESTGYPGERCFYTYVPECATEDSPLVYDIHGVSLCPLWNFMTTGWVQKAVENCFVVVWPVGNNDPSLTFLSCFALEGGFVVSNAAKEYAEKNIAEDNEDFNIGNEYVTNDCCCFGSPAEPSVFDDMTFLRNVAAVVVDKVSEESNGAVTIDTKRIYMGGHSNGCSAGLAMAAVHSDMVAAVCCHAPALVTPFPDDASYKAQAVPIWFAHGKVDGQVNYNGSFGRENFYVPGAEQTNEILGAVNNCKTKLVEENEAYSSIAQVDCDNQDARVELMSLETAGHTPFFGADLWFNDLDGAKVTNIDTTQRAWEFCSGHARLEEPVLELVTPEKASAGQQESESDEPTTQDAIDAWKARNSGDVLSSSSTTVISYLLAVSMMAGFLQVFVWIL